MVPLGWAVWAVPSGRGLEEFHELIEEELSVQRAGGCFRMELHREPGVAAVAYAFVGAVVHIHEEWLPFGRKALVIDGVTVVLGGDVAFLSPYQAHRLVVTAVAELQLVGIGSGRCP